MNHEPSRRGRATHHEGAQRLPLLTGEPLLLAERRPMGPRSKQPSAVSKHAPSSPACSGSIPRTDRRAPGGSAGRTRLMLAPGASSRTIATNPRRRRPHRRETGYTGERPTSGIDRDRGQRIIRCSPPTPPDVRVRIRRFGSLRSARKPRDSNAIDVGVGQSGLERDMTGRPPPAFAVGRDLRGMALRETSGA